MFNSLNSRKLEVDDLDVFDGIGNNSMYLGVQGSIFVFQIIFVQFGGRAIRTHALTLGQHLACIIISSSSLIVSYLCKTMVFSQIELPNEKQLLRKMSTVRSISFNRGKSFNNPRESIIKLSNKNK
jgi:hypothetical protein